MKYTTLLSFLLLLGACTALPEKQQFIQGKQLSFQRNKGNCLACHTNKAQLRAIIWDATQFNPQTSMPPFGKNKILTTEELERVVDYIWSLN